MGGIMKKITLVGLMLSLSTLAWANESFRVTGGLNPISGSYSTILAEEDAESEAQTRCAPADAIRISGWKYKFLHYGQSWLATAQFICN
jgi:hypothetical protein